VTTVENKVDLSAFGFSFDGSSSHNSRTIMLSELETLLNYVAPPNAQKADYLRAITEENCLGKRSGVTRKISAAHLVNLYLLDPDYIIFRSLRYFWFRDTDGQPLLALLCAYARDYILQMVIPFMLKLPEGAVISKAPIEDYIENKRPGSFSKNTLESTVRNVASSLTKSGHLSGKAGKIRSRATPTAGSVSYALFLGYLCGERGESLFNTPYTRILDCPIERMIELAETASRSGWIVFKHIDKFFEVLFTSKEMRLGA
jgi:hypothetical protein